MLPYLQEVQNPSKKYSVVFRGLNYGEGTQDGEFAETYNLSTDKYPCITQRAERVLADDTFTQPSTLHAKGDLLVIDGKDVLYGGKKVGEVTQGKKQTATVGNYIIIFPDKKYYKVPTEDDKDGEFGNMEVEYKAKNLAFSSSSISWGYKFPFGDGNLVTITGCSVEENNKQNVLIKSATNNELTFANGTFAEATEEGEVTITRAKESFKVTRPAFTGSTISHNPSVNGNFPFLVGDVVTISGCPYTENNKKDIVITSVAADKLEFDGVSFYDVAFGQATDTAITITRKEKVFKADNLSFNSSSISLLKANKDFPFKKGDSVTITGCSVEENNKEETAEIIIKGATVDELTFDNNSFTALDKETQEVTIKRSVPELDFICESNYRLWGTHGNTIYSSKYSDPINFKSFEGLAGDSYFIDVGSEGEFTGCIPYSSHICFFKENTLHKLYGTKPSNFQVATSNVYGVQSGSERSMQIVNEQLLYKGVGGIYAYTGGVPELISEKFGNKRYSEAVACCDGEKYYISMKSGDTWDMFAYDVMKNIWLREDDTQAVDMTFYDGKRYVRDAKGGLYYIDKTADRGDIEWGATFCTMHETINERKGYSKFHLRMDLAAGAWLAVDIKTDNDLQWRQVYTTHNEKAKTVSIPIMPTRCDSIDIRIRGKGKCTIKTFIREFSVGSDV